VTIGDNSGKTPERNPLRLPVRGGPVWVIGAAVVVLLVLSDLVVSSGFYGVASLSTLTPLIGIMIIVTTGQAFVISTGGIDLSVPSVVTLMGVIALKQGAGQSGHLVGVLIYCVIACLVIGLLNGILVEALRLPALVVTLAVGQLVSGFTLIYQGPSSAFGTVPHNLYSMANAQIGGSGISYLLPIAIGVAVIATFFLHRIVPGRRLVASSASARAAFLAGIRANRYRILAYVAAALAYGFGGVLAAGQIGNPDLTLGNPYLLASVVSVVLGGAVLTGGRVSPFGSMFGAVFITVLGFDLQVKGLSAGVQEVVQGAILILALSLAFVISNLPKLRKALMRSKPSAVAEPQATAN
jgi:ribose transport system permease protein